MDALTILLSAIGGSVVLIPAATWLATRLVESRLNRDIEAYKTTLQSKSDSEIENLKHRLQLSAMEREVAVTWLHQKRAAAIETLFVALVDLRLSVRIILDIFSPRNPDDIRRFSTEAFNKSQDVYTTYLKAKIFLSPLTCDKIEGVLNSLQDPVVMYHGYLGNYDDHELNSLLDVKENAWKEIQNTLPAALQELEIEFRKVLGVDNG